MEGRECRLACVHPPLPHCFRSYFLCFLILQASWPHFEDKELVAGSRGLGPVGGDLRSPTEPRGLSRLGFQRIRVNPHRPSEVSSMAVGQPPRPSSCRHWADRVTGHTFCDCPCLRADLRLKGRVGFQWVRRQEPSCQQEPSGPALAWGSHPEGPGWGRGPDPMLGYQSFLLWTSGSPTASLGPARSCLDQYCPTELSGMMELSFCFIVPKVQSSYKGLVQLRNWNFSCYLILIKWN